MPVFEEPENHLHKMLIGGVMDWGCELIIFDCDGVLVDSEKIANQVFSAIIKEELGLELSFDTMLATFLGKSTHQCMQTLEEMVGHALPSNVERRYDEDIQAALAKQLMPVSGVHALLASLQQSSFPFCVASSGSHKNANHVGEDRVESLFTNNIYSTSDVQRGKPFPDVYLHAAQAMGGFQTSKCLVIEDSPLGVQGAVAAGMVVFGYAECTNDALLKQAGAHRVFDDMATLL